MSSNTVSPAELQISEAERWEVADQLGRVLVSPWFRTSSRSVQLLRHVVELSIHGQTDRLKERQIAIEAFYRKPTYDNNTDPVVRVAAGEVRKRLAQYYNAPENTGQIRIELPIGSYVPVFRFPCAVELLAEPAPSIPPLEESAELEENLAAEPVDLKTETVSQAHAKRIPIWIAVIAVLMLLVAAGAWREFKPAQSMSGFDSFWAPVLASHSTPLISVGELRSQELTFVPDSQRNHRSDQFTIAMPKDLPLGIPVERVAYTQAVAKVASVLGAKNKPFDVLDQSETTFADVSGRTMVLLGSYDNDWTMGISDGRRFGFKADYGRKLCWISDSENPEAKIGVMDMSSPEPTTYEAFSIVMRQTGQVSRQIRVVIAGVGDKGTVAAADFISNPQYLNDFALHAPKGWANKNIEFLIQTRVIENIPGIPTIVAYSIW